MTSTGKRLLNFLFAGNQITTEENVTKNDLIYRGKTYNVTFLRTFSGSYHREICVLTVSNIKATQEDVSALLPQLLGLINSNGCEKVYIEYGGNNIEINSKGGVQQSGCLRDFVPFDEQGEFVKTLLNNITKNHPNTI